MSKTSLIRAIAHSIKKKSEKDKLPKPGMRTCPYCRGTGLDLKRTDALPQIPRCSVCGGSGRIPI